MPIKSMTMTTTDPGHLVQVCAVCGAEHTISFDRGAQKSKTGPFALEAEDTLTVKVDEAAPAIVIFAAGAFPDFRHVTAAELAAKIGTSLAGVRATDDFGGVLIESNTTGAKSRIEITGGTARAALGFLTDGRMDPCVTRPVLGVSFGEGGEGAMKDKNVLALRRCNNCGSNECLVRTFDTSPPELEGSFFKEHRKAVNALADYCKSRGWSHPHVAALHAAETDTPADLLSDFPEKPCLLPPCEIARAPRHHDANGRG